MNGYISDKLTFTNSLHTSPEYPRKLESYLVVNTNPHYFMDDLFHMILLNAHIEEVQIRIIDYKYNSNEDFNMRKDDNLYYSYYHKKFNKQRFLLSNLEDKKKDFREFYGARKYNSLIKALSN